MGGVIGGVIGGEIQFIASNLVSAVRRGIVNGWWYRWRKFSS